jgi:hypothetical protein
MDSKIIYTKNLLHLGDCIYSLIFFYNIHHYLKDNNIFIYFYCTHENYPQINDFNNLDNVKVFSIDNIPNNQTVYDLWIGSRDYDYNWFVSIKEPIIAYDVFFCKYYNTVLKKMNIPVTIEKFVYKDTELLKRYVEINTYTNGYYNNIDFLINNATPNSGQFDYDLLEFNQFIMKLSRKYKIVTTQKVGNIKCTRDYHLSAKDIAAISLNIKHFIAIESGIIAGLYNEYIADNPNVVFYNLSKYDYHFCSFENFHYKKGLDELRFLHD